MTLIDLNEAQLDKRLLTYMLELLVLHQRQLTRDACLSRAVDF